MSTTLLIILIGLVLLAAIAGFAYMQKRRTAKLRSRFGPEYERAIHDYGDKAHAEKALEHRAERTTSYQIHSLPTEERQRFSEEWLRVQARFVDNPKLSIQEADNLISEVMGMRGYPMADFDRRAEDLSVDHPDVVRNYRAAHEIATAEQKGQATTEDLRRAMVHYRELFDELVETQTSGTRNVLHKDR
jgi:hypothetical protein